jgi:hypothetical protein
MKFAIIPMETDADFARRTDPVEAGPYWAGWTAYSQTLVQAGIFVQGAGLEPPSSAVIVRQGPAGRIVQDGPFAEVKERLGGFFIIDVPDLDAAIAWAARAPVSAQGAVEVRPVLAPPPGQA